MHVIPSIRHTAGHWGKRRVSASYRIKIYYILDHLIEQVAGISCSSSNSACNSIAYSHGGQYLAAGINHSIFIIDAYTNDIKHSLMGHGALVVYLSWGDYDDYLVSACRSRAICWKSKFEIYKVEQQEQDKLSPRYQKIETNLKADKVIGCCYDIEYDLFAFIATQGADTILKIVCETGKERYYESKLIDIKPTSMLLIKKVNSLIIGTQDGIVRIINWPPFQKNGNCTLDFYDVGIHSGSINKICSDQETNVITIGSDSTLYFQSIKEFAEGLEQTPEMKAHQKRTILPPAVLYNSLTSYSMMQKQSLKQAKQEIKATEEDLSKKKGEKIDAERKKDKENEEKITKVKLEHSKHLAEYSNKIELAKREHVNRMQLQFEKSLNSNKQFITMIENARKECTAKLNKELEKYGEITSFYNKTKGTYSKEVEELVNKNQDYMESMQMEYKIKYDDLQKKYNDLLKDMEKEGKCFEQVLSQYEQDFEEMVQALSGELTLEHKKENLIEQTIREKELKEANEADKLEQCLIENKKINRDLKEDIDKGNDVNKRLQNELNSIRYKLTEKEEQIRKEEDSIKSIRNSSIKLENLKIVLENKIESAKEERVPLEAKIKDAAVHTEGLCSELMKETQIKKVLDINIKASKEKIEVSKKILKTKKERAQDLHRKMDSIQYDIISLLKDKNYNGWPGKLCELYNKYSNPRNPFEIPEKFFRKSCSDIVETIREEKNDYTRLKHELIRQRDSVNNKMAAETKTIKGVVTTMHTMTMQQENENEVLITDCNLLRDEGRYIGQRVGILEKKFKEITGIQLKNIKNVEEQLDKLLIDQQDGPKRSKIVTPFEKIKDTPQPTRVKSLLDFYSKYSAKS